MTTELPQEKREKLLNILEALLAKTTERGATEGEALAAAEKAQEIMDKYGLSLQDIQATTSQDTGFQDIPGHGRITLHEVLMCCAELARFTGTKVWINKEMRHNKAGTKIRVEPNIRFFGLHADVDVAVFLYRTFQMAMEYEWAKHWKEFKYEKGYDGVSPRTARRSFMAGMAMRLNERLETIREARQSANVNDCRAIVVAKTAVVEKAWAAAFDPRKFQSARSRSVRYNADAFDAGQAAGNNVDLGDHLGHGTNRLPS